MVKIGFFFVLLTLMVISQQAAINEENLKNLLDSITKSNVRKINTSYDILKQEALKKQEDFELLKEDWRLAHLKNREKVKRQSRYSSNGKTEAKRSADSSASRQTTLSPEHFNILLLKDNLTEDERNMLKITHEILAKNHEILQNSTALLLRDVEYLQFRCGQIEIRTAIDETYKEFIQNYKPQYHHPKYWYLQWDYEKPRKWYDIEKWFYFLEEGASDLAMKLHRGGLNTREKRLDFAYLMPWLDSSANRYAHNDSQAIAHYFAQVNLRPQTKGIGEQSFSKLLSMYNNWNFNLYDLDLVNTLLVAVNSPSLSYKLLGEDNIMPLSLSCALPKPYSNLS